jgi:hypothetical protein
MSSPSSKFSVEALVEALAAKLNLSKEAVHRLLEALDDGALCERDLKSDETPLCNATPLFADSTPLFVHSTPLKKQRVVETSVLKQESAASQVDQEMQELVTQLRQSGLSDEQICDLLSNPLVVHDLLQALRNNCVNL